MLPPPVGSNPTPEPMLTMVGGAGLLAETARQPAQQESAGQVDRDGLVPDLKRGFHQPAVEEYASRVHQPIKPSKRARRRRHRAPNFDGVGYVRREPACADRFPAAVCACTASRSSTATAAPSRANRSAVARPMPEAPPVMAILRPASRCIAVSPFCWSLPNGT